ASSCASPGLDRPRIQPPDAAPRVADGVRTKCPKHLATHGPRAKEEDSMASQLLRSLTAAALLCIAAEAGAGDKLSPADAAKRLDQALAKETSKDASAPSAPR